MLAPHPCLACVRLEGQNVARPQSCFAYSSGYTLEQVEQVDLRVQEVGHADTRKTNADSRSEK